MSVMEFCPNCGKVLTLKTASFKAVLKCSKCGYEKEVRETKETVSIKRREKKVAFIEKEGADLHPKTTDVICPSCGNREASWWTVQTRSADEPMTQFFRCTKCGYTWREYA